MGTPIRLLLVEDDEDDALLTLHALREGGLEPRWKRVASLSALDSALTGEPWDAVLCDYRLAGFGGPDALSRVRASDPDLPFILVTGSAREDEAVSVLKAGAQDYLSKDRLRRLPAILERELGEARRRRAHREAERSLALERERLDLVLEATGDVVYDWDAATDAAWVSEAIQPTFGYPGGVFQGGFGWWMERIHPDDRERVAAGHAAALAACAPIWTSTHRFRRADGSWARVLERARVLYDDAGRPSRMVGVMTDLTALPQGEEEGGAAAGR